jgi:hypothetical protein
VRREAANRVIHLLFTIYGDHLVWGCGVGGGEKPRGGVEFRSNAQRIYARSLISRYTNPVSILSVPIQTVPKSPFTPLRGLWLGLFSGT